MKKISSSIQVLDRAMALVGVLSRAPGPISLTRLAGESGLLTASAHRILGALVASGSAGWFGPSSGAAPKRSIYGKLSAKCWMPSQKAGKDSGVDCIAALMAVPFTI
jgi:hypothetical protein